MNHFNRSFPSYIQKLNFCLQACKAKPLHIFNLKFEIILDIDLKVCNIYMEILLFVVF